MRAGGISEPREILTEIQGSELVSNASGVPKNSRLSTTFYGCGSRATSSVDSRERYTKKRASFYCSSHRPKSLDEETNMDYCFLQAECLTVKEIWNSSVTQGVNDQGEENCSTKAAKTV